MEGSFLTARRKTREVMVGDVGVGGNNPVRIQSMTTSNTRDVIATAQQIIRLADCGCEIVRVTVQGKKEAEACEGIKNYLIQKGYKIPLVADIHFYPPAALHVIEFVDKVRINPGNYLDRRAIFKQISYDENTYQEEIKKIEEGFSPLIEKCIRLKKAMRIGTNHGSLSDRIMNRYGDTPAGMVESALEFARVCRLHNYHDFIFSMKASNPLIMVQAYRLLTAEMIKLGWDYPLHLGVTEAGDGEDGRVKSAMGIGSLLLDGLGDTIRVSLTEDPWFEIDPCKKLVQFAFDYQKHKPLFANNIFNGQAIGSRESLALDNLPLHRDGSVYVCINEKEILQKSFYEDIGCRAQLDKVFKTQASVDMVILKEPLETLEALHKIAHIKAAGIAVGSFGRLDGTTYPIYQMEELDTLDLPDVFGCFVECEKDFTFLQKYKPSFILWQMPRFKIHQAREFFKWLKANKLSTPVVLSFAYEELFEDCLIQFAAEAGALLVDKLGDGLCLEGSYLTKDRVSLAFNVLQGCRMRSSKTEYIACPGCGRTLFGLQEVTAQIRKKTAHLPGVKIAIMGCIVNGPGEMADADFGYVGAQTGKIDLYIGKMCVEKGVDAASACDQLIALIKSNGRWVEPDSKIE
ncbi:MAG: (E)-4-hydroxy-3-methylbut-2-enyl-diphosphate synthase [Chlamydiota bacterium]